MQLICENPYRILGLSITASDREIAKRVSNLSVYAEMGKAVNYDYDFVEFAPLERNVESIMDAERKLEQPKDKLFHSLFWISYDENNSLIDKNINTQSEIINNISDNNAFDLHNKAIITLFSKKDFNTIKAGINYFNDFLAHVSFNNFINKIVGKRLSITYSADKIFYEELLKEIKKNYEPKEILELFKNTPKEEYITSITIKPIIYKIESEIESTKAYITKNSESAYRFGKELINNTSENLKNLETILLENDLEFTSISNKLAEQILECSIAYFNKNFESTEMNIGSNARELAETAKQIAKGSIIIERIEKDVSNIQDWIDNIPLRKKRQNIKKQEDIIFRQLEIFSEKKTTTNSFLSSSLKKTPEEVERFLDSCFTPLFEIRDKLGMNDDLYMEISSVVSSVAISVIIAWYNHQAQIYLNGASAEATAKVFNVFKQINRLDMDSKTSLFFSRNFSVIKQNNKQQNGNCYIATMVYGDYDAPEVIVLRKFRDNKLSKTIIGKWFIAVYYKYSPKFVKKFKRNKLVNKVVKKVLDKLIGVLK